MGKVRGKIPPHFTLFGGNCVRRRVREAIVGYFFSAPIIIVILAFTIVRVFQALYYSFTDYDALLQQKYNYIFNPEFSLQDYFVISLDKEKPSLQKLLEKFDPVDFVEYTFGFKLDDKQKKCIGKIFSF